MTRRSDVRPADAAVAPRFADVADSRAHVMRDLIDWIDCDPRALIDRLIEELLIRDR